jgi:DNA polymerase III alpha subunit
VEDRFIEETLFLDYFLIVFEFILIVGCEGAL